ncbi:LexA family transcriptional regulator [Edwardsiella ictaluri]|uniref:LexA family transcriptional regulator n=1 Tax=Edwardsiella ictaluri TaxID=67780 RepID=A0ABY8GDK6_EDWIC|nr:LexA family transcriptional regulator [Edwardsiella ictaluri]ELV7527164.1 LexA family transcriptional regulator [Edwardsiella ictaluri]WFN95525.1 LexA family transcriptional regulator [Edwardsiella ictaluri]
MAKKQGAVLAFIREFIAKTGFPPTRVEIANGMGYRSPNAAEGHLHALDRKGAIELVHGIARGIRITEAG